MEDYNEVVWTPLDQPSASRWRGRRWLLIGGLALAIMLALGVGAFLGLSTGTTQAAGVASGNGSSSQTLAVVQGSSNSTQSSVAGGFNSAQGFAARGFNGAQGQAAGPGARGQCQSLTVSSVSGNTIVAKTASGISVTIHTTASTQYTQAGKTVAASAIKAGTRIMVMGTHNSDGSITATSIDVG
jgi:Domain of unknown function (DUF5666)